MYSANGRGTRGSPTLTVAVGPVSPEYSLAAAPDVHAVFIGSYGQRTAILVKMTSRKLRIPRPGVAGGESIPEYLPEYPAESPTASVRGYVRASCPGYW